MIRKYKTKYRQFSMAFSGGRIEFLWDALLQVTRDGIEGDFVECGVYKGGNCMVMAEACKTIRADRNIWLYDTFTGMPRPTKEDVFHNGKHAKEIWYEGWCEGTLDEVKKNMEAVGYPHYELVEGMVEDTIPDAAPESIAILRLDTDFYKSTKHELIHLYPRLEEGGYLIIDDYHSWQGSRQACDEVLPNETFNQIGSSNAAYLRK